MDEQRLRTNPNLAIVGSTSLLGKELKEMIDESDFPKGKLVLLETEEYAGLLQEFAGEIRITQIISPNAFDEIDIAFFTCSPEIMNSYVASGARFPDLTIDLTQTDQPGTLFLHGISDPRSLQSKGYFVSPHPAAIVLARILSRLHHKFGLESAAVTIMEPVSEHGKAGGDELHEQTVSLLNFHQFESRVFEGQIAFNLLQSPAASQRTEDRVLKQIAGILGQAVTIPMITAVQAPVFHSHCFSLFVQLLRTPTPDEIRDHLRMGTATIESRDAASPVGAVGSDKIHIGRVHRHTEHSGAYSLWIVADNLRIAASNALQTAENIIFAPAVGN
jgi:aspartate-semialdehyde dehydrogenase